MKLNLFCHFCSRWIDGRFIEATVGAWEPRRVKFHPTCLERFTSTEPKHLSKVMTSEMSNEQWPAWKKMEIDDWKQDDSVDDEKAERLWEDYIGQEGYTMRDELISERRFRRYEETLKKIEKGIRDEG